MSQLPGSSGMAKRSNSIGTMNTRKHGMQAKQDYITKDSPGRCPAVEVDELTADVALCVDVEAGLEATVEGLETMLLSLRR